MSTWIKVYNSMPAHPKLVMAGDRAGWLFVCGLCYSNEHLTDGFIPKAVLPIVAPGMRAPEKAAAALVDVGLWHEATRAGQLGWQIHDYEEVQRSSDEIRSKRISDADRQRKLRESRAKTDGGHGDVAA